mgnify:CR=1 FL=1
MQEQNKELKDQLIESTARTVEAMNQTVALKN